MVAEKVETSCPNLLPNVLPNVLPTWKYIHDLQDLILSIILKLDMFETDNLGSTVGCIIVSYATPLTVNDLQITVHRHTTYPEFDVYPLHTYTWVRNATQWIGKRESTMIQPNVKTTCTFCSVRNLDKPHIQKNHDASGCIAVLHNLKTYYSLPTLDDIAVKHDPFGLSS